MRLAVSVLRTIFLRTFIRRVPQVSRQLEVSMMAQRSITSFFNRTVSSHPPASDSGPTTPPPKSTHRKRRRISSSGSEPETSKQKTESLGDDVQDSCKGPLDSSPGQVSKKERTSSNSPKSSPKSSTSKAKKKDSKAASLLIGDTVKSSKSSQENEPTSSKKKIEEKVKLSLKTVKKERTSDELITKRSPKSSPHKSGKKEQSSSEKPVDALIEHNTNAQNHTPRLALDSSIATLYDPSRAKYHPTEDACWSLNEPVPYLALAKTLEAIEATSARLRIVTILSNYLRSVIALTPDDLLPSMYLCLNRVAPAHHGIELGVAETFLMKAIAAATGRTLAQVKASQAKVGDLGLVAEQSRSTQRVMCRPAPLTVRRVLAALRELASLTGTDSVNKKVARVQTLFVACRESEARYLIRSLAGKLRVGLAEQSVLQALAQAVAITPPAPPGEHPPEVLDAGRKLSPEQFKARVEEHALLIKTTYCECPDYERVVGALLMHGVHELPAHCRLTPGVPLKPMLAHPTRGVREVLQRFEGVEFTCEWKYDGERAQIHVPSNESGDMPNLAAAMVFSRNQEDNTSKYPDILGRLSAALGPNVNSCVLDCEAVAWDVAAERILPFQILSTRKRKAARIEDIKVPVIVFMFDLLYLNGRALVKEPLAERRRLLQENFVETPGQWRFAVSRDCTELDEIQEFLEESVKGSCEGLMVKTLSGAHATYEIAKRSRNWLKLKKDYLEGCGDSVDAVVIGGYWGKGKRAGALGGFLLACYEPESEQFQSLCKLGTGLSDADLQRFSAALLTHRIEAPRAYYAFDSSHEPDVWLAPQAVWEIRCADLSLSPAHRAAIGLVDPDKGISLRFPRFVRERDDKKPEQATAARQIADMYLGQESVQGAATAHNDDDFY